MAERDTLYWQRLMHLWERDLDGDVPNDEIWTLIQVYKAGAEFPPADLKAEFERLMQEGVEE